MSSAGRCKGCVTVDNGKVPTRLEGEKVVLREKRLSDAENDYAWGIDPELCRLDAGRPLTLSFKDAKTLFQEELAYPAPRRHRFGIDTKNGLHIGNCMVYDISERRGEGELGIMIGDRRFWNKSFGTDAVETLLRFAFTHLPLKRIYLHTLDWNVRAQKSFAKGGFDSIGVVQRNKHTFIHMEILKVKWESIVGQEQARAEVR